MNILEEARAIKEDMIRNRRALHVIPEIGLKLPKTVAYVASELDKLGIRYEIKEDISCIFAWIGEKPEEEGRKCILLRADMDALAVLDQTGEPFAVCEGRMHACGHDLHTSSLLGAARLLKAHESELNATVKLLFQAGEETFNGFESAIKAGVLENPVPDVAYTSHVFAMYPMNQVIYNKAIMSAFYGFEITLTGIGGHGSAPELCVSPINAAVQVYLALQSLIAREAPASEEVALTIGQFTAGEAANIIPATATLKGTLRAFNEDIRQEMIKRINEIVPAVAAAYRCTCDIKVLGDCPAVVNDPDFMQYCLDTIRDAGISDDLKEDHVMVSEDFALAAARIPSCYVIVGACPADTARGLGQHNPAVRFNEDALVNAAASYAAIALNYR